MRVDAHPDLTVLWFALGLTAITALGFGLVPALQASTDDRARGDASMTPSAERRTWLDPRQR